LEPIEATIEATGAQRIMQRIKYGYRGFSLLVGLNADRLIFLSAIGAALTAGAFLGSL